MTEKTFKIVFCGELAFDTDADEVSAALSEKCGYPQPVIDKILSSKKITIKKGLNIEQARRYKNFFDRLGLMCDMVSEQASQAVPPLLKKEPVKPPQPVGRNCPKCGAAGQTEQACSSCGIIFERFEKARNRQYEYDLPIIEPTAPVVLQEPLWQRILIRPEVQITLILAVIMLFRGPLHNFYLLAVAMTTVGIIAYGLFQANETGDSALDLCSLFIALWPNKMDPDERQPRDIPLYTILITSILIACYYLPVLFSVNVSQIVSFLPLEPTLLGSLVNFFLAPFLHTGSSHLWLNIIVLWLLSCHIEMSQGKRLLLFVGLATLGPQLIYTGLAVLLGARPHLVGTSALISCLSGFFIIVKSRSFIESSLPVIAPQSCLTKLSIKIEVQPLVLTACFFLISTGGHLAFDQATALHDQLYPLTGILCGFIAGYGYLLYQQKNSNQPEKNP